MAAIITVTGNVGSVVFKRINKKNGEQGSVMELSLASNHTKKEGTGDNAKYTVLSTDWYNCELWGNNAEHLSKVIQKGAPLRVEGWEEISTYEKDGETQVSRKILINRIYLSLNSRIESITLKKSNPTDHTDPAEQDLDDIPQ